MYNTVTSLFVGMKHSDRLCLLLWNTVTDSAAAACCSMVGMKYSEILCSRFETQWQTLLVGTVYIKHSEKLCSLVWNYETQWQPLFDGMKHSDGLFSLLLYKKSIESSAWLFTRVVDFFLCFRTEWQTLLHMYNVYVYCTVYAASDQICSLVHRCSYGCFSKASKPL